MENETVKYTSDNGYTGVMYGVSSFAIFDKDGNEVMHTGSRAFNTYDELVKQVNEYPEFIKILRKIPINDLDCSDCEV